MTTRFSKTLFSARRRWRWGLALGIVLAIFLGHGPLLSGLASILVVRQPSDGANFIVLRGSERGVFGASGFRAAVDFCQRDPSHRILLIGHHPGRLVELGILPSWETFARGELARRGVPAAAVAVVKGKAVDDWDDCRLLAAWLKARPEAIVAVAANPLGSRCVRYMLDAAMTPSEAARAPVFLLDDLRCTPFNWYKSRSGVKGFMFAWLDMIYAWRHGSDRQMPPPQSVEAYQKTLSERFGPRRQQNQDRTDVSSLKGCTSNPRRSWGRIGARGLSIRRTIVAAKVSPDSPHADALTAGAGRRRVRRKARWLAAALAIAMAAGLWFARGALLPAVAHWLDVGQRPQPADAIMLLTGGAETRAFAAAALCKCGWAPRILVSTVAAAPQPEETAMLPEHEVNVRVLLACGVPKQDVIVLNAQARTTFDEAKALSAYLEKAGHLRILLVTNGYHTRRARWIFAEVLGSQMATIVPISVPTDEFEEDSWWRSERGFAAIAGECMKLGFYRLRYGNLGYLAAAVALLWLGWRVVRRKQLLGNDVGAVV